MNPDANMQDQTTDQNDPLMDNKYIVESAQQILNDEQANPGSQDAEALEWARAKVNLPVADTAPAYAQPQDQANQGSPDTLQVPHGPEEQAQQPAPEDAQALQYLQQQQQAPAPQAPQPDASQEAASPDGHTLYIDRSQPEAPAQPNGTTNGDNNGNSN